MFNFRSFFDKKAKKAPQSLTDIRPIKSHTLSVSLDPEAVHFLKVQLDLDINAKELGWRVIPFQLLPLLDMETALKRKSGVGCEGVDLTSYERGILAEYAAHYYTKALDIEDFEKATAYNRFVFSILDPSNLIKLPI